MLGAVKRACSPMRWRTSFVKMPHVLFHSGGVQPAMYDIYVESLGLPLGALITIRPTSQYPFLPSCAASTMNASDGIGKAMANQLAKKGMNVLLISRTESKLVDAEAELKAACPSVAVEHLAIDYSNFDAALQVTEASLTHILFTPSCVPFSYIAKGAIPLRFL